MMLRKETCFDGYLSGDSECFCLDMNPDEIFSEDFKKREKETSYPDVWFPKEAQYERKYRIRILIEMEELSENSD